MPCGRPTRPTGTRSGSEGKGLELGERLRLARSARRAARSPSYAVRRCSRSSVQYAPGSSSYGHADAARVDRRACRRSSRSNCMCVWPTTTTSASTSVEEERDALLGRDLGEDVEVVPRRRVAEEHAEPRSRAPSAAARAGTRSAPRQAARVALEQLARREPVLARLSSRSALPRSQRTRSPSARSRSSVSAGIAARRRRRRRRRSPRRPESRRAPPRARAGSRARRRAPRPARAL